MGLTVNRRRVQHNVKRHRKNKKPLILGALVFFIFIAGFCFFYLKEPKTPPISTSTKTTTIPANVDNTITFIVSGDELPHTSVDQNALTASGSYNYLPFFSLVQPYMTSADMSFCNQESPSDPNDAVSGYPTFNAPSIFPQDLQRIGCNIINLANNHADDKGQAGIDATLDVWDSLKPLAVAGTARSPAEQNQVALFTVKGVRFAFLAYTQCSNGQNVSSYGLNIFSQTLAGQQINEAKQHADIIIAAMHSCDEDHSTEDAWQDATASYFASQGVDIVVGTGPHWLQPVQRLPKAGGGTTIVWYSLGNMLSTQLDINGLIGGIGVMKIDTSSKTVTFVGFMPTYMHYEWTAAQKAADDESARHNLMIYPLDQSSVPLANSQDDTTVEAQTTRVTQIMNKYTPVTMLISKTFPM